MIITSCTIAQPDTIKPNYTISTPPTWSLSNHITRKV